jgi:deazaflavin-dependent oxidoreductase (nitroreductase family)
MAHDGVIASDFNSKIADEFRANDGKVGGMFAGAPMLLLTTVGARSGRRVTNPLVYQPDGDRIIVIASSGGAPTHPAWYHNLLANPEVEVEVGGADGIATYTATAEVLAGDERDRLWARQVAVMPGFADYQAKTTRLIPVVALSPSA